MITKATPRRMDASRKPPLDYRPDIDGLRGLAVMLVLFHHLKLEPFTGGFIGVDVFFVISGFLITRKILEDFNSPDGFSFIRFYQHRARRILPALFATLIASALASFLLLTPEDFQRFGGSLVAGILGLANICFFFRSDYFGAETELNPLLHLWSLGVEEQFYIVWPFSLLLLLKNSGRTALFGIITIAILSFGLSEFLLNYWGGPASLKLFPGTPEWLINGSRMAYYLMPGRIFELALGAVMVWGVRQRLSRPWMKELLLILGLGLIIYPALTYTSNTPFPGQHALLPCLGSIFLIYAGPAPLSGWLLRNPLIVGLGLISYSLYLIHWPLIVFFKAYTFQKPSLQDQWLLLIMAMTLAHLMFHFIEQPFRRGRLSHWQPRQTLTASAISSLLLMLPGIAVLTQQGWPWRIPEERLQVSTGTWHTMETQWCSHPDPLLPAKLIACQNNRNIGRKMFIWGDSHARHLIAGISESYKDTDILILYQSGCIPQSGFAAYVTSHGADPQQREKCIAHNREVLDFLLKQPAATIILTGAKRDGPEAVAKATAYLLEKLRGAGHTVAVLGDFIRPGKSLVSCRNVPAWLISERQLIKRCTPDRNKVKSELSYSEGYIKALPEVIDVRKVQCPGNNCQFMLPDGKPMFRDDNHLTTAGSIWLISQLKKDLPPLRLGINPQIRPVIVEDNK